MSSTELSYEFPRMHCLNSPLHLDRSLVNFLNSGKKLRLPYVGIQKLLGAEAVDGFLLRKIAALPSN